jgi:hypothetical protein
MTGYEPRHPLDPPADEVYVGQRGPYDAACAEIARLEAELVALKARRCDQCHWYEPEYSACDLAASTNGEPDHPQSPMHSYDAESYASGLTVEPDHACNAWTART